jgi:hypothetical protein
MPLTLDKPVGADEALDQALAKARALLARPRRADRTWPALAAAAFFAASSILFVTVIVLAPTPPAVLTGAR